MEEKTTIFGFIKLLGLKKTAYLILFLLINIQCYAQDLDIYKHHKNSNFEMPVISKRMTYQEFKILSTDLRMQDMVIAAIFPGHVHFKIGEKKAGYYILGTRSLGYLGWAYLSLTDKSLTKILFLDQTNLSSNISTGQNIVAYGSLALIIGSYLYDWIHGQYILADKQDRIRYKYAPKKIQVGLNIIKSKPYNYPGLSIAYKF